VLFAKRGAEKGPPPVDLGGKIGRNEMNPARPAALKAKGFCLSLSAGILEKQNRLQMSQVFSVSAHYH
jgi:hypothetical protein